MDWKQRSGYTENLENMMTERLKLKRITVEGYRGIRQCAIDLTDLQVIIGPTGVGKSDLLSTLICVKNVIRGTTSEYISSLDGGASTLFYRPDTNRELNIVLEFAPGITIGRARYKVRLYRDNLGNVFLETEISDMPGVRRQKLEPENRDKELWCDRLSDWQRSIKEYKPSDYINIPSANDYLHPQRNIWNEIGYQLYNIQYGNPSLYKQVISIFRKCILNFDRFEIVLSERNTKATIYYFKTGDTQRYQLSTLSADARQLIALVMNLVDYEEKPGVIMLHNPETGLHPDAILFISDFIRYSLRNQQVIMITNSPTFLDNFAPEEVVVMNRENRSAASSTVVTERQSREALDIWLKDGFYMGDLWKKGVIRAGMF